MEDSLLRDAAELIAAEKAKSEGECACVVYAQAGQDGQRCSLCDDVWHARRALLVSVLEIENSEVESPGLVFRSVVQETREEFDPEFVTGVRKEPGPRVIYEFLRYDGPIPRGYAVETLTFLRRVLL